MRKNSKIHLWLETDLKKLVEMHAKEEGISICEYCRKKIKENDRIIKIEITVDKILEIITNRKIYK